MYIIWLLIMVPCSALLTGIGIYAWRRKEPMWFWSGSTVKAEEISDVRAYNKANGITPASVQKGIRQVIEATAKAEDAEGYDTFLAGRKPDELTKKELHDYVGKVEKEMKQAVSENTATK